MTTVLDRPTAAQPATQPRPWRRRPFRVPSTATASTALTAAITLLLLAAHSGRLWSDSYFDLYAGRYVATHGIPHHEIFTSADPGHAWMDQQWLAHLLYYASWRVGGYAAMILLSAALVTGALVLVMRTLLAAGARALTASLWTVVALGGCLSNTVPRAQSFAYPLFVVVVAVVFADSTQSRWRPRLLLLVPLLTLWANVHGSVVLGVAIIVGYAGWRAVVAGVRRDGHCARGYSLLASGAVLSLLVTPYGFTMWRYYAGVLGNSALTSKVSEWSPPSPGDGMSLLYFITGALVITVVSATSISRRRLPPAVPTAVVVVLLAMSARAVRNEIWFVLAGTMFAGVFAGSGDRTAARRRSSRPVALATALTAAVLATVAVATVVGQPSTASEAGVSQRVLAAADHASATSNNPVLADELQATGLLWSHSDTAGRVVYDIRFEQYAQGDLAAYMSFLKGDREALAFAARYRIVLLSANSHARLLRLMRRDPRWQVAASSRDSVLFTRRGRA